MSLSPIQRLLRRAPALRWGALQYALKQRAKRAEGRWEYRQSVLVTVGNVTIMWAGIERMLDELIAYWQHLATDLSKEHPRALSKKLCYLKDMQRDERLNAAIREFLRTARIEAKRLGAERHDIIHGLLHNIGSTMNWRTQRVIYDGPLARIQQRNYTNDDLQRISREIAEFSAVLSPRIWVLIGGDPSLYPNADEIEQARREFGYA